MRPSSSLLVPILALLAGGCSPACEQTCRKLLDCDLSPRVSQEECVESCETQQHLYEVWGDEEKQEAFDAERGCVRGATCEEIAEGACYDDEIWVF